MRNNILIKILIRKYFRDILRTLRRKFLGSEVVKR